MKTRVLKFDTFKKGGPSQDPKKQIQSVGKAETPKKEKFIDQLKRASLSQDLKTNEPDYSKVNEDADIVSLNNQIAGLQTQINSKNADLQKFNAELARLTAERDKKQSEAMTTTTTTTKAPAAPSTPATPPPATTPTAAGQAPAPAAR